MPGHLPAPDEAVVLLAGPLAAHSGATARDFHPLPFSLAANGEHLGIAYIDTIPPGEASNLIRLLIDNEGRARRDPGLIKQSWEKRFD